MINQRYMKKVILFLFIGLGFMACRKDLDDTTITDTQYTPPVIKVNGTVAGQVVDEQGNGIEGAIVHMGSLQRQTGPGGYYIFRNAVLDANGTFVKVDHPGYFHSSTRLFPKLNSTNYATLTLMAKNTAGQVEAATGGTVTLSDGAHITLPAGGIVTSNGTLYTGRVDVAARWLNPSSPDLHRIMPGNLQGINANREEVALATYGMLAVELIGESGERLNLGLGKQAELFFPLPASLQGSAPNQIPLWYFDETSGLWREEGKATKSGNGYTGNVKHFSFWNCDDPFNLVDIEGLVVDADGHPLTNTGVYISFPDFSQTGSGVTNSDGIFGGKIPKDQLLVLQIKDNCGVVLLETNIGPLSEDTNLGTFTLSSPTVNVTTISGTLVNCDGDPISEGVIRICTDNNIYCPYFYTNADGTFEYTFTRCSWTTITATGFDLTDLIESQPVTYDAETEVDLGDFSVCANPITEYFKLNVDGTQHFYPLPYYSGQAGALNSVGVFSNDSTYVAQVTFPVQAPGTYVGGGVSFFSFDFNPTFLQGYCQNPCGSVTVTVTEFGAVGGYIRGTFSGNVDFYDDNQQLHPNLPVTGEFSVIRLQ